MFIGGNDSNDRKDYVAQGKLTRVDLKLNKLNNEEREITGKRKDI